jgi:hypothetical protein
MGWQQFVYAPGALFIQYWLLNYATTCPAGWNTFGTDCWRNSDAAASVPTQSITNLANLVMTGSASGKDVATMVTGDGTLYAFSQSSVLDLTHNWTAAEFNVFGDGNGSAIVFNNGATVTVQVLTDSTQPTTNAPACASEGFTGETSNLNLVAGSCCPLGGATPGIQFIESNDPNAVAQGCEMLTTTSFFPGLTQGNATASGDELTAYSQGTNGHSSSELWADVPAPALSSPSARAAVKLRVLAANATTATSSANVQVGLTVWDPTGTQVCSTTTSIAGTGAPGQTPPGEIALECPPFAQQAKRGDYKFDIALKTRADYVWDTANGIVLVETASVDGDYPMGTITDNEGGRCLETWGADPNDESSNGNITDEWECWGGSNQQWQFESDGTLRNVEGMCFDVSNPGQVQSGIADRTPVDIWSCIPGLIGQKWQWLGGVRGTGLLISALRGPGGAEMCLTSPNHVDGEQLVIRPCFGSDGQVWVRH